MTIEIIPGKTHGEFDIRAIFDIRAALHLVQEAMEDIADAIEDQAKLEVPVDTGELKLHPVDKTEITVGILERYGARAPAGSPGGIGGQFVRGPIGGGETVASEIVSVAEEPKHAKWVHDGTGIYGASHLPIKPHSPNKFLKFRYKGKNWLLPEVKGQKPNPYLERAFVIIDRTYLPIRVERLRLEIKALPT